MTTTMTRPSPSVGHITDCDHHAEAEVTYVVLSLFSVPGGPHSATATVATPGEGYLPLTGLVVTDDAPVGEVLAQLLDKTVAKIGTVVATNQRAHTGRWVIVTDSVHLMWAWEDEDLAAVAHVDSLLEEMAKLDYIELEVGPDSDCPCLRHGRAHAYRMSPVRAMTKEERRAAITAGPKNRKQRHRAPHVAKK